MPAIQKINHHAEFQQLMAKTVAFGETNDCAVKAIALIAKIPYEDAHALLKSYGRVDRSGTMLDLTLLAMKALGMPCKIVYDQRRIIQCYPAGHPGLKNVTSHHPRRFPNIWAGAPDMMFKSQTHISSLIDGQLVDWSVNQALRVRCFVVPEKNMEQMEAWIRSLPVNNVYRRMRGLPPIAI